MDNFIIKPASIFERKPIIFDIVSSTTENYKPTTLNNNVLEFDVTSSNRQFTDVNFMLEVEFKIVNLDDSVLTENDVVGFENNILGTMFESFICKFNNNVVQADSYYWLKSYIINLLRTNVNYKNTYLQASTFWYEDTTIRFDEANGKNRSIIYFLNLV